MNTKIKVEYVEEVMDYLHLIDEFNYGGQGYVIKKDGKFIGLIKGDEPLENEDAYFVDEIRIIKEERSKGYGRIALESLKQKLNVTQLEGVSVPESRGFWEKLGANFYDRCLICPFSNGCEERETKASREACGEYDTDYFITN